MCHYNVSLPVVQPLRRLMDDKLAKSIESQKRILLSQTTASVLQTEANASCLALVAGQELRAGCEFSQVPTLLTLVLVEAKNGSRV